MSESTSPQSGRRWPVPGCSGADRASGGYARTRYDVKEYVNLTNSDLSTWLANTAALSSSSAKRRGLHVDAEGDLDEEDVEQVIENGRLDDEREELNAGVMSQLSKGIRKLGTCSKPSETDSGLPDRSEVTGIMSSVVGICSATAPVTSGAVSGSPAVAVLDEIEEEDEEEEEEEGRNGQEGGVCERGGKENSLQRIDQHAESGGEKFLCRWQAGAGGYLAPSRPQSGRRRGVTSRNGRVHRERESRHTYPLDESVATTAEELDVVDAGSLIAERDEMVDQREDEQHKADKQGARMRDLLGRDALQVEAPPPYGLLDADSYLRPSPSPCVPLEAAFPRVRVACSSPLLHSPRSSSRPVSPHMLHPLPVPPTPLGAYLQMSRRCAPGQGQHQLQHQHPQTPQPPQTQPLQQPQPPQPQQHPHVDLSDPRNSELAAAMFYATQGIQHQLYHQHQHQLHQLHQQFHQHQLQQQQQQQQQQDKPTVLQPGQQIPPPLPPLLAPPLPQAYQSVPPPSMTVASGPGQLLGAKAYCAEAQPSGLAPQTVTVPTTPLSAHPYLPYYYYYYYLHNCPPPICEHANNTLDHLARVQTGPEDAARGF
ncbi:unnamed protein product [Protopolystoma xenopodis]|uniref:Uncharacterized protein n=1 Tax=Protopolystoma xenopodis TaxID=117903 RepID=A0A3S4ZYS9_9PLAT|nr:unnamed protein product [Protopolystoma xenopodis]